MTSIPTQMVIKARDALDEAIESLKRADGAQQAAELMVENQRLKAKAADLLGPVERESYNAILRLDKELLSNNGGPDVDDIVQAAIDMFYEVKNRADELKSAQTPRPMSEAPINQEIVIVFKNGERVRGKMRAGAEVSHMAGWLPLPMDQGEES